MIKNFLKKYFDSLSYFYSHLKFRIIVILGLSILIGILDGIGLSLFLPLLQMVSDPEGVEPHEMGKLNFIIDFISYTGFSLNLLTVLMFMVIFFVLKGIIQFSTGAYRVKVQEWFIEKLRVQNIQALNSIKYKYFVTSDVGRIQNTLTGEVDRVANSYNNYFKAFEYGILVIVYMAFAFLMNPQFALLVSIGGVLTNFLFNNLYKSTIGYSKKLTGENNVFQRLVIQSVSNYKYLKATGSLKEYEKKITDSIRRIKNSNSRIGLLDALLTSSREPILIIVVVLVIYIQIKFLDSDLASILISLLFFYRALNYLMQMQVRYNQFLGLSGSLENMTMFGTELQSNREETGSVPFRGEIKKMELKKVSFSYGSSIILKDLSLEIKKNETIAFVGESGSGKSTLVNILAGLLPVDGGIYKINNTSSADFNIHSFQKKIGYITQDPVIFNDTLINNITFWTGTTGENKSKFWKAVKEAAIFDFVMGLPEKENTILGNNGVNLSGGQKQRISIARELFKEVEVLILDEATSALDSETEKMIQNNIDALKGKYIILVIAHRLSTIKNADRIVVMKNGNITHVNNFNNLLNESPYFQKLVSLQIV